MSTLRTGLQVVAALLIFVIYLSVLLLISVAVAGFVVAFIGFTPYSGIGLLATAIISASYIAFEFGIAQSLRPAPVLVLVVTFLLMPLIVKNGLENLSTEYNRIRQLLADVPRFIFHRLETGQCPRMCMRCRGRLLVRGTIQPPTGGTPGPSMPKG